ncbi:MAG: DUF1844 domain-containing protein [Fusobacteria bacterium]|nr:DUF1844 domain-containing protein [Fusobacteriota bacterium]
MDNPNMFQNLVYGIEMQAMISMGKLTNPITGQMEKNIEFARINIDILKMIQEKTKGNLNSSENVFLNRALTDLELNYTEITLEMIEPKNLAN